MEQEPKFDAIVIGTGFAGAVTTCRLTEAGLRILVLERGRRFQREDFPVFPPADIPGPESDPAAAKVEAPDSGLLFWGMNHGMWDVRDLGEILAAQAAGYGGGSLLYANVHLRPPAEVFEEGWPDDYRAHKLKCYFDLAAYMLDVKPYPAKAPDLAKTTQMESAAKQLGGTVHCFRPPLAVNFGPPLTRGATETNRFGRKQGRCELRGECCFGCRAMAKNTLDLNYLALAERPKDVGGPPAEVRTLAEVLWIRRPEEKRSEHKEPYEVGYRDLGTGECHIEEASYVFLCAGSVHSTELLLKSRVAKQLPCPGPEQGLGKGFFPNADSIAVAFDCQDLQEVDRGPTITSALLYQDDGHWLLFEDGGMPTDLEPFLGVLRSPLWLGRNRFREETDPPLSARAPRIGYATLPFQSVGNAVPSLSPSLPHWRSPLLREIGEALLEIGRGLRSPAWHAKAGGGAPAFVSQIWKESQLLEALLASRDQLREGLVFAAEPFVVEFLAGTAEEIEKRLDLEKCLQKIPLLKDLDLSGIPGLDLAERLLRLGAQLVWGSQGGLVRAVATQLLESVAPKGPAAVAPATDLLHRKTLRAVEGPRRPRTVARATDLLRWLLDFRISDSRTAMILCMGRDSDPPADLSIEIPEPPPIGSLITGVPAAEDGSSAEQKPRATGILLGVELSSGSWALDDAAGSLTLASLSGKFEKSQHLFAGDRRIGVVAEDELPLEIPLPQQGASKSAGGETPAKDEQTPKLFRVRFEPPISTRAEQAVALNSLLGARLRAHFREPPPSDPESDWSMQERVLRDIVKEAWKGELRTDPMSAFLRRRLTVHAQGGCAMGAVTGPDGEVIGCPGLYVMDAAAFPRSVGVNPSAAILAIAEYKVEKFIQSHSNQPAWKARHFDCAQKWMDEEGVQRRHTLDPLRCLGSSSKPPTSKPVGIRFEEKMTGRCGTKKDSSDHGITADLTAEIGDLAWFLELYRRGEIPRIDLGGKVCLTPPSGAPVELKVKDGKGSYMRLFRKQGGPAAGGDTRLIEYQLLLTDGGVSSYLLTGTKTIHDEVGSFDLWTDVRTLEFEMKRNGAPSLVGVLEVPAAEFFGHQLASFEATNTKDPARRIWALTAFGKLFFGHLLDVYLPELKALGEAARRIAERTHV